jgi:hypothetical protein
MLSYRDLRPYQLEGVRFLRSHPQSLLLMDMGTGKTITVLTMLAQQQLMEPGRTLIIAPKRVALTVWAQEAAAWSHTDQLRVAIATGTARRRLHALRGDHDVLVTNYENLVWLFDQPEISQFSTIVFDEISMMKNTSSNRFKKYRKHIRQFKRRIGLTGTPVPNKLIDLFGVTYALDAGARFGRAITPFKEQYFETVDYHGHQWAPLAGTEEYMYAQLAAMSYRIPSEGFVDIPALQVVDIHVDLPPRARELYKAVARDGVGHWDGSLIVAESEAVGMNKLQQIAQGFVYDEDGETVSIHSAKLDALSEIREELQGRPLIVGYTYKADLAVLAERFPDAVQLAGVDTVDAWNRGEIPMLLLHPKSGAHGLNLQRGGSHMVLYGLNWSLELYQQLIKRLARPGQEADTVYLMRIICDGTIDTDILTSVEWVKATRQQRFLDSVPEYS